MRTPRASVRVAAISIGVFALSLLSCGREVTAPHNGVSLVRRGMFSVDPQFPKLMNNASLSGAVEFEKVRVVLRRADGSVALDTMVLFPVGADSVSLAMDVPLGASTGASGENLKLSLGYVNAAGDTVFKGGPVDVTIVPRGSGVTPPPIVIPVVYSGPGSTATAVQIAPRAFGGYAGDRFAFSASAVDASGRAIVGTPVFWSTSDGSRVILDSNLGGVGGLGGARGTAKLYAQLLTGQVDSVTLSVLARPQRLELVSGENQTGVPLRALPNPLVVRVLAADGLPVSGISVGFAPSAGTSAAAALSDASGLASTSWTLPAASGHHTLTASIAGLSTSGAAVVFNAHVVLPRATKLVFLSGPSNVGAGAALPAIRVAAQDSTGTLVPATSGQVTIGLTGGTAGAVLGGAVSASLVEGIATFADLTVSKSGTGYGLTASAATLTSAGAGPFAVAEGAATRLRFTSEGGGGVAGRRLGAFRVTAFDAFDNVATLFTGTIGVRLATNPGSANLLGASSRAAVAGVATFDDLAVDKVGVGYALGASATGLTGGSSASFDIVAGSGARLQLARGAGQTAPVGAVLDTIIVAVTDSLGNRVTGASVGFSTTAGNGTVSAISSVTNAAGVVRALWTLGATAGTQHMLARSGALLLDVSATAVGGGGPTRLFIGFDSLNVTSGSTSTISLFASPAPVSNLSVTLTSLDTLAQWTTGAVTIPAGASSVSTTVSARLGANGYSRLVATTASAGADTLVLRVQPGTVRFSNSYYELGTNGDTLETQVTLSSPAPAGGVTVSLNSTSGGVLHMVPSPGTRAANPYNPCSDLEEAPAETAVPAKGTARVLSGSVTIRAGELAAYVYVFGDSAGSTDVTPVAAGYGSLSSYFYVSNRDLYLSLGNPQLLALGQRSSFYVDRGNTSTGASLAVTFIARTPGVVNIPGGTVIRRDARSIYTTLDGIGLGRTWVVAQAPGFNADSAEVVVTTPKLHACCSVGLYAGDVYETAIDVRDSTNAPYAYTARTGATLVVSAVSRDTNVVRVEASSVELQAGEASARVLVRGIAAGSAWVVFTAPGHSADSVTVSTLAVPALTYNGAAVVGAGQYISYYVYRGGGATAPLAVSAVASNPAVVSIDSLRIVPTGSYGSDEFRVVGRAPGASTLTFTAAGYAPLVVNLKVSTPWLVHTSPCCLYAGGAASYFNILPRDSIGVNHYVVGALGITLRSLDTLIAKVDTALVIPNGGSGTYAYVYPRTAGSTSIIITAPGYRPDTVPVTVSPSIAVTPALSIGGNALVALGKKQSYSTGVSRNVSTSATTVTVTQGGSATTVTPASFAPGVGVSAIGTLQFKAGAASGQDFVIVSAPGLASDTVTIRVGKPKLQVYGPSGTVLMSYPSSVDVYVTDSLGYAHPTTDTLRIAVSSSDSAVARTSLAVITILPGAYYGSATISYRGPGRMRFRLHELSGLYADDSTALTTVVQPALHFDYYITYNSAYIGMRQRTDPGEVYIYTDYAVLTNTWVRLTRSTTGLASVPDSVMIPSGASSVGFQVTGADTVGSLQLTASSPGYASALGRVEVTRPAFWVNTNYAYTLQGSSGIEVWAIETGNHNARQVTENVNVSVALDSAYLGTLSAATVQIPAGATNAGALTVNLSGVSGSTGVRAFDARSSFQRYLEAREDFSVEQATSYVSPNPLSIGVGQAADYSLYLGAYVDQATVVAFNSSGSHSSGVASHTVASGSYYDYGTRTGVSVGTDTVRLVNARMRNALFVVQVDSGSFYDYQTSRTVKMGDSVYVQITLRTPGNDWAVAAVTTTMTVTGSNGLWSSNASTIRTLVVPPGSSSAAGYFKPSATGVVRIAVTAPGYRSTAFDIQVTP